MAKDKPTTRAAKGLSEVVSESKATSGAARNAVYILLKAECVLTMVYLTLNGVISAGSPSSVAGINATGSATDAVTAG